MERIDFIVLILAVCLLWVSSEWSLIFLVRSTKDSVNRDEGSLVSLNVTVYLCSILGVILGFLGIGYIPGLSHVVPWIGLLFIVVGIVIRWIAILTLRKYFTVNVVIRNDHRIIKSGIYRFIRHPSYAGSLVSFLGLGLVFVNGLSVLVIIVPVTIAFLKRIKIEEYALKNAFGEEYIAYRKSTGMLFPGLFKKNKTADPVIHFDT